MPEYNLGTKEAGLLAGALQLRFLCPLAKTFGVTSCWDLAANFRSRSRARARARARVDRRHSSGTPCCSSKHDSKLFRSTGTRGCAPFGPALRYWTGHAIGCSSSEPRARANTGIAQKLASHDHCIRLFRPNDVLRLHGRSDHSDRAGHDPGFAADALGKGHLVTGTDRNFRVGHITTGRTIDEIDSH